MWSGGPMRSAATLLLLSRRCWDVLEHLASAEDYRPDLVAFLQCTSPLTTAQDIDGTINALIEQDADSALAVTPFHYFLWQEDASGNAVGINHDKMVRLPRQQREPQFVETGAVYIMWAEQFRIARHRFFGRTAVYTMPTERHWEIDEPSDLIVAESLLAMRHQKESLAVLPDRVSALVLDFDGVFTDNKVVVLDDGAEAVVCHRGDGMGLSLLKELPIKIWVLSSEVVSMRSYSDAARSWDCPISKDWLETRDKRFLEFSIKNRYFSKKLFT